MAPKMMAIGLDSSMEAAPVLWGMPPVVLEGVLEAAAEPVLERVAVETVVLWPADGTTEAEATAEEAALVMAAEAEALMLETAAEADDRAAEAEDKAEETASDPPVKGN